MNVNLVQWNSLNPKKAIIPTFSGQTQIFLGENNKTRINNLHHRKDSSVAVILSLRVGVQHKQKKWCNNVYNAVAVECTLYLARPHKDFQSRCAGHVIPVYPPSMAADCQACLAMVKCSLQI